MRNGFCVPQGVLGRLGGRLMALDHALPAGVLDKLQLRFSDSVLEVGPGPGVAVELAAARVPQGLVAGIDPSETMLTMARRRNRKAIEARRLELRHGTVSNLPFDDATFDACVRPRRRHSSWGFKHDRERFGYGLAFRKQRSTCIIGRIDAARVVTTRLDDDALVWGVVELSHVANKGEPSRQSRAALRQCRA